jgi:hypothetical protein
MNRDEQKQITALVDRALAEGPDGVPVEMDVEADAIIRALFVRNPEAAYRVTKLAVMQSEEIEMLRGLLAALSKRRRGWLMRLFRQFDLGSAGPAE